MRLWGCHLDCEWKRFVADLMSNLCVFEICVYSMKRLVFLLRCYISLFKLRENIIRNMFCDDYNRVFICKPINNRASAPRLHHHIMCFFSFLKLVSCSPCRWSVMAYRRNVLSCDLRNKTSWISTRRKGAVCKANVLPLELRRKNSSRLTRKRRATCRVNVQLCALRKRLCCRNRSSWRKTLPGQWVTLPQIQLRPPPPLCSVSFAWLCSNIFYCTVNHTRVCLWSSTYWCCFASDSSRAQNAELSNSLKALERSQQELEKRLAALQLQHQQDSTKLQSQLDEADSRSKALQKEVCSYLWEASQNHLQESSWQGKEYFNLRPDS